MVTKLHKSGPPPSEHAPLNGSIKDSAQQIWQAGLGAFAKAQAEGTRAFEALVKEGTAMQRKTQAAAEERISEATSRMTHMATDIGSRASGHWDKLENIFEERVAKALNKLGVPSAKDVNALIARINELTLSVQKLTGQAPAAAGTASARRRKAKGGSPTQADAAPAKAPAKARAKVPAKAPAKAAAKARPKAVKAVGRTSVQRKPANRPAAG